MEIGVVFPQTDIGQDPAMIRDYAQAVEAMGYTHILAFDSVVGANPDRPGGWDSPYTSSSRPSVRTSTIAAGGSRNSSRSCGFSGPGSW